MTQSLLDGTALDLVARAINETQTEDPAGDYFDGSVLEAILKFRKAGAEHRFALRNDLAWKRP